MPRILIALALLFTTLQLHAQQYLQRQVRVVASGKPLSEVLREIGHQGGFSFSYNSNAVAGRRLITINEPDITVAKALDALLKGTCSYKEVGKHIVLQATADKFYEMSGYVLDANSGQGIAQASVYERQQLVAALTNEEGFSSSGSGISILPPTSAFPRKNTRTRSCSSPTSARSPTACPCAASSPASSKNSSSQKIPGNASSTNGSRGS